MKRLISAILIFMLLTVGLFAYADNNKATITQVPGNVPFDVDADYIGSVNPNKHIVNPLEGVYAVTTEDESITVTPKEPKEELQLVVHFFDPENEETQGWLEECFEDDELNGIHPVIRPFEIYYLDKTTGNRIELDEEDIISIGLGADQSAEDAEKIAVYRLVYEGDKSEIESDLEDGKITFMAGGTKCYFALVEKVVDSGGDTPGGDTPGGDEPGGDEPGGDEPGGDEKPGDTEKPEKPEKPEDTEKPGDDEKPEDTEKPGDDEKPGDTEKPDEEKPEGDKKPDKKPTSPDTGNGFNLIFWISLMVSSACAIAILWLIRKRENE